MRPCTPIDTRRFYPAPVWRRRPARRAVIAEALATILLVISIALAYLAAAAATEAGDARAALAEARRAPCAKPAPTPSLAPMPQGPRRMRHDV